MSLPRSEPHRYTCCERRVTNAQHDRECVGHRETRAQPAHGRNADHRIGVAAVIDAARSTVREIRIGSGAARSTRSLAGTWSGRIQVISPAPRRVTHRETELWKHRPPRREVEVPLHHHGDPEVISVAARRVVATVAKVRPVHAEAQGQVVVHVREWTGIDHRYRRAEPDPDTCTRAIRNVAPLHEKVRLELDAVTRVIVRPTKLCSNFRGACRSCWVCRSNRDHAIISPAARSDKTVTRQHDGHADKPRIRVCFERTHPDSVVSLRARDESFRAQNPTSGSGDCAPAVERVTWVAAPPPYAAASRARVREQCDQSSETDGLLDSRIERVPPAATTIPTPSRRIVLCQNIRTAAARASES